MLLGLALVGSTTVTGQERTDSLPLDSIRYLGGITVDVARPSLTQGAASAVVADLDSLAHTPAPSLEEVVRALPLVHVRTNSRGEAQPALRGSQDRQILVLMDGVPLTLGWDHRTDLSVVPLTAARRVTLVRGLSSVLYGPNTLGGVLEVDLVGRDPSEGAIDPLTVGVSVDQTGAANLSAVAGHRVGAGNGRWTLRGGAGLRDRSSQPLAAGLVGDPGLRARFLADGDRRLNSDLRQIDGFLAARYRAERGTWASASVTALDIERGVPPEAHQDAPRLWRYPSQRRLIGAVGAGTGERDTALGTGGLEASVGLDLGSTEIESFVSEAFQSVSGVEDSDDRVLSFRLLGNHSLWRSLDVRAAATLVDIAHDEVLTGGPADAYRQRLWSVGAEVGAATGPGRRTALTLGGAVDGTDTPEAAGAPRTAAATDYGLRIGASSLVLPRVLVHGGLSRRSRFPSLRELYSTALGRFEPNPSLRPETLLGSEAGVTTTGPLGELQLVAFHHLLDDGIVRTSVTGSGGEPRLMRVNQAEIRATGLEALLIGQLAETTVSLDLTVQSVTGFDGNGSEVPLEYQPSILGNVRLDGPLPVRLRGSASLGFVGEQSCENPEVGGLQGLGSSRSLDLSLRRGFELGGGGPLRRVTARASMLNATDAAVFDQCGLPRPGRLFQIQFRVF